MEHDRGSMDLLTSMQAESVLAPTLVTALLGQPASQASKQIANPCIDLADLCPDHTGTLLTNCCERQMLLNSLLTYNSSMNHYQ